METAIAYFRQLLHAAFSRHLKQKSEPLPPFKSRWLQALLPQGGELGVEEQAVLLLALMPHISPQSLDLFFFKNKDLDIPYTEFGGWKGASHGGFLPTGQTAQFLMDNAQCTTDNATPPFIVHCPLSVVHLFSKEHWFYKENILHLEGAGEGEPLLSGRLVVSEEFLARALRGGEQQPEYSAAFPAKRITTPLEWADLVLPYNLREELNDVVSWLRHQAEICERWQLGRIVKQGYRCLFYGPPGTGKTLTATLLGKQNGMEVYRVDLSMIVSKYIGETEKNLAKVFDKAEHHNWILFFDEADALFGQRTEAASSNDRHANQEVAYLLQRIEDFPGMVILATNLKENIDEAFFRRFQSSLYFPMPDEGLRYQLWQGMLPREWLPPQGEELLRLAAGYMLSGGSMVNVIQSCAVKLHSAPQPLLTEAMLRQALRRELEKEGSLIKN
ncbi:MAG: ATP-binding protein [Prevotellaceae bacterium]|jgi:hypothetical protein|nr:ATP-binding protein [Prevotellaceae bacterium]